MRRCLALLLVCAFFGIPDRAAADVILSNLPGTASVTGTNLGLGSDNAHRKKAVGVRTGAEPLAFESMLVWMDNSDPVPRTLSGGIYTDVGDAPGTLLASFAPFDVPANSNDLPVTLTVSDSFTLAPATQYWFLLDGPSVQNTLLWAMLSPNTAPTPSGGVTWEGYRFSSNGGASYVSSQSFNTVTIRANPVPEPACAAVLTAAGFLLLRRLR